MSWAIGYDNNWKRDIGYGVPAVCDHPDCKKRIDRGLDYVCGGEPYGGERGCGLYFCDRHGGGWLCERCAENDELDHDLAEAHDYTLPFDPKPDVRKWLRHKLKHHSWQQWRDENANEVRGIIEQLGLSSAASTDAKGGKPDGE